MAHFIWSQTFTRKAVWPAIWSYETPKLMQTLFRGCNQRLASLFVGSTTSLGTYNCQSCSRSSFKFMPSFTLAASDLFKVLYKLKGKNLHLKGKDCQFKILNSPTSNTRWCLPNCDILRCLASCVETWSGHKKENVASLYYNLSDYCM